MTDGGHFENLYSQLGVCSPATRHKWTYLCRVAGEHTCVIPYGKWWHSVAVRMRCSI